MCEKGSPAGKGFSEACEPCPEALSPPALLGLSSLSVSHGQSLIGLGVSRLFWFAIQSLIFRDRIHRSLYILVFIY